MGCSSSTEKEEKQPQYTNTNTKDESKQNSGGSGARSASQIDFQSRLASLEPNPSMGGRLRAIPLLNKLSDDERNKLGGLLVEKKFEKGVKIVQQGERGDGFYLITAGSVVVQVANASSGAVSDVATLNEGDFFGETSLVNNAKRGATVVATTPVSTFYLAVEDFNLMFGASKLNVQFAKRAAVSSEQERSNASAPVSAVAPANAVRDKSKEVIAMIDRIMKDNVVFMNLDYELKAQLIAEMWRAELRAGVAAVKQGDMGDNLYVIESGEFEVVVGNKRVATRGKGTMFGELALMYNSPRAATVTALTDAVVWVIDRFTFRRIVTGLSSQKFEKYVAFLKKVPLLTPLAEYERKKIAEALEEVTIGAGQIVFKQGEEGDAMYIVYSGEVTIRKSDGVSEKDVMVCRVGDYFGERAILTNEPRAATALTSAYVQLLKLDRNAFSLLLGPLDEIMRKNAEKYERKQSIVAGTAIDEEEEIIEQRKAVTLSKRKELPVIKFENLKVLGTLGKGSFGFVQLVQDKTNATTYALKAVSKAQIVQTGQQGHVMSEKKAMMLFDHPFLIKLFATYKDKNRLYFLLEPSLGGELFSVLRERTLFDEDTARFYAASVLLAFEYMHDLNIIYRDLKPENLLLDKEGFLKVTDFGFAKDISAGKTWTLCGTPDYLAPEIVAGKGHGKGVDWWTLGIFIYEMLASYPPFYDEDPMKTYGKIMTGAVSFPSHFSREAVSLIKKLLQPKPTKRLGVTAGGAAEIKKHPFFKSVNWDDLLARRVKPPIVPKLKSNTDLSNFDDYSSQDMGEVDPYVDDGSNWDAEF